MKAPKQDNEWLVIPTTARWRIVGWIVLTAALAVLALLLTARSIFLRQVYLDANAAIVQEIREFNAFASEAVDSRTRRPFTSLTALMERYLERQTPDRGEAFIAVTPSDVLFVDNASNDAGERLAGDRQRLNALINDAAPSGVVNTPDGELRWGKSTVEGRGQQGVLLVAQFVQSDINGVRRNMLVLFGVMLAGMLLTASIAWLVAGQILAPVKRFARLSERVGPLDLTTRLPEDGNDELAGLARAINGMLDRLSTAHVEQRHVLSEVLAQMQAQVQALARWRDQHTGLGPAALDGPLRHLRRLTHDLALLIDSGQPGFLHQREVKLDALTHELAQQLRQAFPERHWQVTEALHCTVSLDPQRVSQGIRHLASNAVEQTRPGETIELGSSLRRLPDGEAMVSLWVVNQGLPLNEAQARAIFETPVHQRDTSPDTAAAGTTAEAPRMGMGLAVVKALAHAHGGYAWVESGAARGTVFGIDLPLTHAIDATRAEQVQEATLEAMQQEK
ncbi:MAG: HAMP domain-containing sensor histidine kinase [Comamonadaceae bacterium]|nr:HAMP domain-containing sensor histidine kinase [Comamonadaceae bacterium]